MRAGGYFSLFIIFRLSHLQEFENQSKRKITKFEAVVFEVMQAVMINWPDLKFLWGMDDPIFVVHNILFSSFILQH